MAGLILGAIFVETVHSLTVVLKGDTHIALGAPYKATCSVDEYRDNRQFKFSALINSFDREGIIVWYYKGYGCLIFGTPINCTKTQCGCSEDGLSTHWILNTSSYVLQSVQFKCSSTYINGTTVESELVPAIPHGLESGLRFNISDDQVLKVLGQQFSVNCLADCEPSCQLKWTNVTSVVSTGAILHIPKLSKDDDGIYTCNADNGYGVAGNKSLRLTVNYGPESNILSPNDTQYNVTEGEDLPAITCSADCRPICNYTWKGPFSFLDNSNTLSLNDINRNQRGVFNCTATNRYGSIESSNVNLHIRFGPGSSLQFSPNDTSVTKIKGSQLGPINCEATCSPPCLVRWTKPDKTVINDSQLKIVLLSTLDNGLFICTASNGIGISQNKSLDVEILYGPDAVTLSPNDTHYTVTEGETINSIECMTTCRPVCSYNWSGPNISAGNTNVLILQNMNRNQRGIYNCTAYNKIGSMKSFDVDINVQFGPGLSIQFNPIDNLVTKVKGEQLGPVNCYAECNPPCHYKWTKPDKTVFMSGRLMITNISNDDHGQFICTASNAIGGSQNKSLNVTVNYGPESVSLSPQRTEYTVAEGDTIKPITFTTDCRPACNYIWSGPYVPADGTNVLQLFNINRNQSGVFNCTAFNNVSSVISPNLIFDVQYRPRVNSILINGTSLNFTVRESTLVVLSCSFVGNPKPRIIWEKNKISLNVPKLREGQSAYTIEQTSCEDNGNYSFVANNSLGMSSAHQLLVVTCSPQLNSEVAQPPSRIGLPKGADLSLTVYLISYPTPETNWFFRDDQGNETSITSNLMTYDLFKHETVFRKTNLTQNDFGEYILNVNNMFGSASEIYHVVPQGPPDPTTILNVTCGVQTVLIFWETFFNGGETQNFSIIVYQNEKELFIHNTGVNDENDEKIKYASVKLLAGQYEFTINGRNSYGNQTSTKSEMCKIQDLHRKDSDSIIGAAAGGGTAVALVVIVVIVLIVLIMKRRGVKGDEGRRNLTIEDKDDDDELKENPLYVSSDEARNGSVPLNSGVNKKSRSHVTNEILNEDPGPVYSQVQKSNASGKRRATEKDIKKTGKSDEAVQDFEMGCVYENSKNLKKNKDKDDVYANTRRNAESDNIYRPIKNKDGLIYADLDLVACATGNKFVIRGLENRSTYAIIDLTKTAEPLPSDEDDDEQKEKETTEEQS